MDYGMIGKIEKAKRYAQEKERFRFSDFCVVVSGENNPHTVTYSNQEFGCDCDFFKSRGRCCHTMALEIMLGDMLEGDHTVA